MEDLPALVDALVWVDGFVLAAAAAFAVLPALASWACSTAGLSVQNPSRASAGAAVARLGAILRCLVMIVSEHKHTIRHTKKYLVEDAEPSFDDIR